MIEEQARVIAIEGSQVTVSSNVKSTCSNCEQVDNCGSGQVAKAIPQRQLIVKVETTLAVNIGDDVMLGLSEKQLLQAAWQVYLWPLFGLFLFSIVGQWLLQHAFLNSELYAIALGLLGGYGGFYLAHYQQNSKKSGQKLAVSILRILPKNIQITEIHC